ncbi:hypothetical protein M426DRAFT_318551 [Hypoxylon sp. CI-4A]|nr:hypothetical protein M426DRAFT_318551 [Hypoxylon sp. CI-4A]
MAEVEITAPNGIKWSQPLGLFINGEWVSSSEGKTIPTVSPVTEQEIAAPQAASADDVDKAVKAARAAFKNPTWKNTTGAERAKLLNKFADLVEKNADILAAAEALDSGKPFLGPRSFDVPFSHDVIQYMAGWADKLNGTAVNVGPTRIAYTIKTPVGVVGQIIPWNFVVGSFCMKLAPALACGNTVVIKLSEICPLPGLYLAKLVQEAGFPPGVVNVINGYGYDTGAAVVSHAGVDKISFTGSTATAKAIIKASANNIKRITLETGGKSPAVIFDDADIDSAAVFTHRGIMSYAGQMCFGNSRIFVQEKVYEEFLEKFKAQLSTVSVLGDPFEATTFQGPLISKAQYDRVLGYVKIAKEEGATVYLGGTSPPAGNKGFYVQPTVFTDVKPTMRIFQEEIFGPCVVVVPFKTEEEALELANDSIYGLSSSIYTNNVSRAHRLAREFEAGNVYINGPNFPDVKVPFGGVKQSGIGSENGEEGLEPFYTVKAVHVHLG